MKHIKKFNEAVSLFDVNITKQVNKEGFNRLSYENQFKMGETIRVKDGRKIITGVITNIEEKPYRNYGSSFQPHSFTYEFKVKELDEDDKAKNRELTTRYKADKLAKKAKLDEEQKEREIEFQRVYKLNLERQKKYDIIKKKVEDIRVELKTEFDLIFVSFLDRGVITDCKSDMKEAIRGKTDESEILESVNYTYKFTIKYPIDFDISITSNTFTKINEDILDINAYVKYIKSRYPQIESSIDFINTMSKSDYLLNILIKTTMK